jgi:hypothetical protein
VLCSNPRSGCTQYQHLHRDFGDFLNDPSGRLDYRDLPPSEIAVNYPMEIVEGSAIGHTPWNGVTRQIPGTQRSREDIPSLENEPKWMKLSVTSPAPAGAAMFRDHRAWVRPLPSQVAS